MTFFVKKTKRPIKATTSLLLSKAIKHFFGKDTSVPILSGKLRGTRWLVRASIAPLLGMWKEDYSDKFAGTIYESSVVYDIGAQVGWYTLLASQLVGVRGKVVAFEPSQSVLRCLKRHVQINRCTNVQIVEAAVSDNDGLAKFFADEEVGLGSLSPIYGSASTTAIVKTVTLDSLVAQKLIPAPNFIKIDIEGGELAALKGAASTLAKYAPIIFLEVHNYDLCVACYDFLTAIGYELEGSCGINPQNRQLVAYKSQRGTVFQPKNLE